MTVHVSVAHCTLEGNTVMTQSHQHSEPKKQGESYDEYDLRTYRSKLNTEILEWPRQKGEPLKIAPTVVMPAFGMMQSIIAGAKYSAQTITGRGKAPWYKKFEAGIMIPDSPPLWIDPETIDFVLVSCDANGVRGSGKRVPRRFPVIPAGWIAEFDVWILDPAISEAIFREMIGLAGLFVGMGSYRPQRGGTNGRYRLVDLQWDDKREFVPATHTYMNSRAPFSGTMQ